MTAFKDWDTTVAPYLRLLEDLSRSAATTASSIQDAAERLPKRPEWPTKAMDALDLAEAELTLALSYIQQAKAQYGATQIIAERAVEYAGGEPF